MKINNIYILFFLILSMTVVNLSAQQDPNYTFYRYNMNLINPAFAGASETTNLSLNVRSQWAGIQGAPETQSLVFGTAVGKNVGVGLSVVNDKTFVESQTSFCMDFSYKLKLNESNNLYFGLKGGFTSYDVNTEGLVTYGIGQDMSLMNIDGRFNPNVGVGVYLKNEKYFVSLSVPKMLTPDRLEQNDGLARLGVDKTHVYLAGGYDFSLSENVIFKPTALLRYVDASPISLDLTGLVEFNNRIDLGAAYRLNESISGIFIFKTGWLDIGYAYEVATENPIKNSDNGTHEILMHLQF
ncbi:type IX secretion system membrane protein PorP/SprF [Maribacter sp. HTCC2170]|uniref:PorP/SprF family type IX secretion system membrane protein n=1 Tax=Maribacter sp. (strain HTCC2170 / KCCM 42371) TaxID=313603 RepID=UPI0013051D9A|nr:type IX secretion system membrane protein PorP/SprF [Maribacter sp. HTCC2170]